MPGEPRKTVLFVSAFDAPFISEDAEILASRYRVLRATGSGARAVARVLLSVFRCDLLYCWFLSVYGAIGVLLARLAGRPAVVVLGGVDVSKDPDLRYGLWLSPWKAALARRALRAATLVLVVDESLREKAVRLAGYDGGNIRRVPTGYDAAFWTPGTGAPGEKSIDVLCVASVADGTRFRVKGIDLLIGAARDLPGTAFTVVGVRPSLAAVFSPPPNMTFRDALPRKELAPLYRSARVYCQPSRHEGLPNALCEAMLCGCVPVAADVGGCRTAVGDTGYLVPPGDTAALGDAIRTALGAAGPPAGAGRDRIAAMFPLEQRKTSLLEFIDHMFRDHP